jgi:hypothetical protein
MSGVVCVCGIVRRADGLVAGGRACPASCLSSWAEAENAE